LATTKEISACGSICKIRRIKISETEIIEENGKLKMIVKRMPYHKYNRRIAIKESEVVRILLQLNPKDNTYEGRYRYIKDLVVLKVGNSNDYEFLYKKETAEDRIGKIEIWNYKASDDGGYVLEDKEVFQRLIVNASHIRATKALFVRSDNGMADKVDAILRCGVSSDTKCGQLSKWTSYYGLQATDSVPVTEPKCIVIDDFKTTIEDKVDVIKQETKPDGCMDYSVKPDDHYMVPTTPFDGMGVIDISLAKIWAKDLGLDYVPASFQIRACGVKGCLFTMDIYEFMKEFAPSGIIHADKNLDGENVDFINGGYNVIFTKSQFKYYRFYDGKRKVSQWLEAFHKNLYGYQRTFNVCSYAAKIDDIKDKMVTAYQPLQSLWQLGDNNDDIAKLCEPTVTLIKDMSTDFDKFLDYIGLEDGSNEKGIPAYYRALKYNKSLANDPFIEEKIQKSFENIIERTYTGKLIVNGNYQVVGSDPFALLQYCFGLKVEGLLAKNEIYSDYWNQKGKDKLNLWRNPHIFCEHWIVKCKSDDRVKHWFKYQSTDVIVSIWDTNLLRANGADCDGDVLAMVDNTILYDEVEWMIENEKARTIVPELGVNQPEVEGQKNTFAISDQRKIMEVESKGFKNGIGGIINEISKLWGIPQTDKTQEYIKILSIVGSLVIDFAKTGNKVGIPKEIVNYIKENKIQKPRFMMYLPQNLQQRKRINKRKNPKDVFSDQDCTLNRILSYMQGNLSDVKPVFYDIPDFNYSEIVKTRDEHLIYREVYKTVKNHLLNLYKQQERINQEKRSENQQSKQNTLDYKGVYTAFYDTCRLDLLSIKSEDGKVYTKDIILDCSLVAAYTESVFTGKSNVYNLIWSMFPDEMVSRAKGGSKRSRTIVAEEKYKEDLVKKSKRAVMQYHEERKKLLYTVDCLAGKAGKMIIYKGDISVIKKCIDTTVVLSGDRKTGRNAEDYKKVRMVLFALLVIQKRLQSMERPAKSIGGAIILPVEANGRKNISYSFVGRMLDLSGKTVKSCITWLSHNALISAMEHFSLTIPEYDIDESKIYYSGNDYFAAARCKRYLKM